jgi:hypothetical protein
MSVYINNTWVHQHERHWVAKAVGFSENGNDVTISACHDLDGIKEVRLVPAGWDEQTYCYRQLRVPPAPRPPLS